MLIICVAAYLRFYQLPTHTLFFGDAGKDLLTAYAAYEQGSIPLVGIASSRPYLHQGPLSLWLSMLGFVFFGTSTTAQAYLFAFCAVAAVIALYELTINYLDRTTAYIATALFAVFPLAVAHARMPYHTTLIPLAITFFLWGMTRWYEQQTVKNFYIAGGAYIIVCLTELSNIPLILLFALPHTLHILKKRKLLFAGIPGFDRVVHATTVIPDTYAQFHEFAARILSIHGPAMVFFIYAAVLYLCVQIWRIHSRFPHLMRATLLSTLVLILAYLGNGQVSEAYMPPFFIFFAIICGSTLSMLIKQGTPRLLIWLLVIAYMSTSSYQLYTHNFFVGQGTFVYESTGELRKIAAVIAQKTQGRPYRLTTVDGTDVRVQSYFDNLRWIQLESGLVQPGSQGKTLYLVPKDTDKPQGSYLLGHFTTQSLYAEIGEP